jgi:hypothetical protein
MRSSYHFTLVLHDKVNVHTSSSAFCSYTHRQVSRLFSFIPVSMVTASDIMSEAFTGYSAFETQVYLFKIAVTKQRYYDGQINI